MTLLFCRIQQLITTDLAALECPKSMSPFLSVAIDLILFILADKEEMHIFDVFEFWPDWTQTIALSVLEYPKIHSLSEELFKICL